MTVSFPHNATDIVHYRFPELLPNNQTVALNRQFAHGSGSITLLEIKDNSPYVLYNTSVTPAEMSILWVIFEAFPYYAPYEMLHASATYGSLTEERVARSKQKLADANDYMLWDQEMRPVRNVLSRARAKVRPCGLDIVSILETGYILKAYHRREGRRV